MTKDLTHAEAREAFLALAKGFGPKCDISPGINSALNARPEALSAYIRPNGYVLGAASFFVHADTWRDLLAKSAALLAEHTDLHASNVIREMALAIIAITADLGECTDAALRAKFDAADVQRYGDRACEQASAMASNGPFSIVKLAGANDAQVAA